MIACCGCGGLFPKVDGPTHDYMKSSPGCWAAYGRVLTREYSEYSALGEVHRLTVDAYAVQHPHSESGANLRSVGYHLCRLCLLLERGLDPSRANIAMVMIAAQKSRFVRLIPPTSLGELTIADVEAAADLDAHREAVRRWGGSVWRAWKPHHPIVRGWVDGLFSDPLPGPNGG